MDELKLSSEPDVHLLSACNKSVREEEGVTLMGQAHFNVIEMDLWLSLSFSL